MATFKQYLQNRWYRWMSTDRTVAYPYQFQYWRCVNVRNEKGAVMLASKPTLIEIPTGHYDWLVQVAPTQNWLTWALKYDEVGNTCGLYLWDMTGTTAVDLENPYAVFKNWRQSQNRNIPYWPRIVDFRDWVFVVNSQSARIYFHPWDDWVIPSPWDPIEYDWIMAETIISALEVLDNTTYAWDNTIHCVYNFADTFFLVALWWVLLRYTPITNDATSIPNWKVIRYFGSWQTITGLSQSGNYLKIYVTDWNKTECHYAQWTFDLEESWMVQTIKYDWVLMEWCLATDWTKDFGLFRTSIWIRLLEMDWYSYNVIRETEKRRAQYSSTSREWERIFYDPESYHWETWAKVVWYNNVLYCALPYDWIWTFTKESVWSHWWVWWWVVEWWRECLGGNMTQQLAIQNWILLTLLLDDYSWTWSQDYIYLWRAEICSYPAEYFDSWYIIWNVYDWWCASLFKKNVSTTLVCWNSVPNTIYNWIIRLGYRYDRANDTVFKEYWTDFIKAIETKWIYDSVFITSVQQDIWTTPWSEIGSTPRMFNKPRNTIEYFIILHCALDSEWDPVPGQSPILYEHNLIYEDSMRKYR